MFYGTIFVSHLLAFNNCVIQQQLNFLLFHAVYGILHIKELLTFKHSDIQHQLTLFFHRFGHMYFNLQLLSTINSSISNCSIFKTCRNWQEKKWLNSFLGYCPKQHLRRKGNIHETQSVFIQQCVSSFTF